MSGPYVPIEEISKHLSVSPSTIRGWVRAKKIPQDTYIKVGNTYRFCIEDVVSSLRSPVQSTTVEIETETEELVMSVDDAEITFDINQDDDL
tara:strand:- start:1959 stop:2234 length:276 start_codon:yes stop_codon:yes gene_type:complete